MTPCRESKTVPPRRASTLAGEFIVDVSDGIADAGNAAGARNKFMSKRTRKQFSCEQLGFRHITFFGAFRPSLRDLLVVRTPIPGLKAWAIFETPFGTPHKSNGTSLARG
jgi:hypothetical protein